MTAGSLLDDTTNSLLDRAAPAGAGIYLMRHGRTALDMEKRSDGWLDMPLSNEGQVELIDSQQMLKQVPLTKIYTPSLKRTAETAHLIQSGTLSDPKIVVDDACKTWNLGVLAGTLKRYSRPEVKQLMDNPKATPQGGESYGAFTGRFLPWFQKRIAEVQKSGDPILIICSGSNLRCLGKMYLYNEDAVDLDEGGLAMMRPTAWGLSGEVILGGEPSDSEYESS